MVNINQYSKIFKRIYIYDNTDDDGHVKRYENQFKKDMFVYFSSGKNDGLSVAFNVMCQEAISNGFNYICLFDQDSSININDLIKMIDYIETDTEKYIGIYAPEIIYIHRNNALLRTENDPTGVERNWVILSGSFINLLTYQKTDGFDKNYFIDRLDYDYCLMIRRLRYKVIMIKNVFLYHALGEQVRGIFRGVVQHSSLRHYYMFRNRLYFYLKKNKLSILNIITVGLGSLKHMFTILLYEKQKIEKLKMIIHGVKDFALNKMGKYN